MLPNFAVLPRGQFGEATGGVMPMLAQRPPDDLASELHCAVPSFGSVTGLVVGWWQGSASARCRTQPRRTSGG